VKSRSAATARLPDFVEPMKAKLVDSMQGFDMGHERPPIVFYAFDLLKLDGKDFGI
jgi:ATP-dependent DNA ligase